MKVDFFIYFTTFYLLRIVFYNFLVSLRIVPLGALSSSETIKATAYGNDCKSCEKIVKNLTLSCSVKQQSTILEFFQVGFISREVLFFR